MLARLKFINPLFVAVVIVPTLIATIYFGFLASDVYISESRFVVRSPQQRAASPLSAVLNGTGLGTGTEEANSIEEFVVSRRAMEEINQDGLLDEAYADEDIFFANRFGFLGSQSNEALFKYYLKRVSIAESGTTQVLTLTTRAYEPGEAQEINARLLQRSEELVNSLSERALADALELAQAEVDEARLEARDAALALAAFRDSAGVVDPQAQSEVGLQMISKLQDQLIAARTQLRQLETYTPEASQIPFLRTQVAALESEIAQTRSELAGHSDSLSASTARYEELQLESEFAQQQLAVVLAALQETQAEQQRKRAYVERIAEPSLPDYPAEPRRLRSILATFILGLLAWGVLSMLIVGVKEHRD